MPHVREILRQSTRHELPIMNSSVLVPYTWNHAPRLYVDYLVRRSYLTSLDMSEAKLRNALDLFYAETGYDGMSAFVKDTASSGNRSFDPVAPVRPVRPFRSSEKPSIAS